jgi:glycerate 2-kinase
VVGRLSSPVVTQAAAAVRQRLAALFAEAVRAVDPRRVLPARARLEADRFVFDCARAGEGRVVSLPMPDRRAGGRLRVLAIGKAAAASVAGLTAIPGMAEAVDEGWVVMPLGEDISGILPSGGATRWRSLHGEHPWPGAGSLDAGRAVLAVGADARPGDRHLVLLSGGASALCVAPADGLTLADKDATLRALMRAGASIVELNTLRRHLSALKGGRLGAALAQGASLTLAISDVPGDDPALIGSGPTVPDPSTFGDALAILQHHGLTDRIPTAVRRHLEAGQAGHIAETPKPVTSHGASASFALMGTLDDALAAVVAAGAGQAQVVSWGRCLYGQVPEHAPQLAQALRALRADGPMLLVAGGEPVLKVTGDGQGGRAQEFALRLALELDGEPGITVLVAGTDGRDGPTDAAGGFADGGTIARARRAGCDPLDALARNDSNHALDAAGDLFAPGPTGTNVADLVLAWVDRC